MNKNLIIMKNIFLFLTCGILSIGALFSCTSEDIGHELSSNAYVLEAHAQTGMGEVSLPISGDEIFIRLPKTVNLETISLNIKISEGAMISPDPSTIKDWNYRHTFTVTAKNGDTRTYYTIPVLEDMGKEFLGSVRLGSQQEVDGFGSNGFTSVGDIFIYQEEGADRITDFSALNSIKEIKGQLVFNHVNCREFTFLNLERLGSLIFHSPAATKIIMPKLKFISDDCILGLVPVGQIPQPHDDLSQINFSSLEYVGGGLEFNYLSKIESLESLSKLSYIGKDFNLIGGYYTSLKGIENIKHLRGSMEIFAKYASLEGFNIEEIEGSLIINNLESASSLKPLAVLKRIGGELSMGANYHITNLEGIENLDVKSITITNFVGLTSLNGITSKQEIGGLSLINLPLLSSLEGLNLIQKVNTQLKLTNLSGLNDLRGLENMVEIENLLITNNPELSSLNGLNDNLNIKGILDFTNCAKLASLSKFSSLTSLGSLRLRGLGALTSLNGLENLNKITKGGLFIDTNYLLTDISALANLQEINFYQQSDKLVLNNNRALSDFCPLSALIQRYASVNKVTLTGNYYNPTTSNLRNGSCSGGVGGSGISGGK